MKCVSYSVTADRIPTREERFVLYQLRIQSAMTVSCSKAMPRSCASSRHGGKGNGSRNLFISQHIKKQRTKQEAESEPGEVAMPVISACKRQRQGNLREFKASQCYTVRPCLP